MCLCRPAGSGDLGRKLRCALAGALPHRAKKATRTARPSDGPKNVKGSAPRRSDLTKILYLDSKPIPGESLDIMRLHGHEVLTTTTGIEALAIMRKLSFDALVIDCPQDTVDVLNLTTRAHGLQPSLAVFLADEWGDELATGLEDLTHVLTMLEDDEFAMMKTESLMV